MTAVTFTADTLALAQRFGAATLHEAAGRIGAFPSAIKPIASTMTLAGPAFTVHCPAFDNLWIHRALYLARRGDILVINTSTGIEAGYWGDILNSAAMARGLGGLVIDGGVRDTMNLRAQPFPVFSNGVCLKGTGKDFGATSFTQVPIRMGDVVVNSGDLIVGDADGVVAIPAAMLTNVMTAAIARERDEANKIEALQQGARTIDLYGFGER